MASLFKELVGAFKKGYNTPPPEDPKLKAYLAAVGYHDMNLYNKIGTMYQYHVREKSEQENALNSPSESMSTINQNSLKQTGGYCSLIQGDSTKLQHKKI